MRRSFNGSFWRNEAGEIIAVNLGADYCAEHEWGISGIQSKLNIKSIPNFSNSVVPSKDKIKKIEELLANKKGKLLGLAARKMNLHESEERTRYEKYEVLDNLNSRGLNVDVYEKGKHKSTSKTKVWGICMRSSYLFANNEMDWKHYAGWVTRESQEVIANWSSDEFCFMVEDKQVIVDMVDAFKRGDIAVWVGSSGPFQNGGLIVAIASRLPQDFVEDMLKNDEDTLRLHLTAQKTGIYEMLKKADKNYFALSPRWNDQNGKRDVVFWLNPREQDKYNFGWFSAKELRQWANNEGPVIKKK